MIIINGDKVVPNVPLSSSQLEAAKDMGYEISIHMRDSIPKIDTSKRGYYVINTDRLGGNGTHWVCFTTKVPIDKFRFVNFFFDSFGTKPMSQIMDAIGENIYYSTWLQQGEDQTNCGHFCLMVLYRISKGFDAFSSVEGLHIGANHYEDDTIHKLPELVMER